MEQNMVDYSGMKAQLASIVEEVKECNTGVNEDANDEEDGDDADGLWSEFGSDAESGMGDPLSRMLMR